MALTWGLLGPGKAYRSSLGVADLVRFDARFLPGGVLGDRIGTADVALLPCDSLKQMTSGVLIEAVIAGKPVIEPWREPAGSAVPAPAPAHRSRWLAGARRRRRAAA